MEKKRKPTTKWIKQQVIKTGVYEELIPVSSFTAEWHMSYRELFLRSDYEHFTQVTQVLESHIFTDPKYPMVCMIPHNLVGGGVLRLPYQRIVAHLN